MNGRNPFQILFRCGAELKLEVMDPAGTLALHEGGHLVGRSERHGDVQRHSLVKGSAEECRHGSAGRAPLDLRRSAGSGG